MPAILPATSNAPWYPLRTPQLLTAGTDAKAVDETALAWTSALWPDLAGAVLTLVVGQNRYNNPSGLLPVTWLGSVLGSPHLPSRITLDVPAAASLNLPQGQYDYLLTATLPNTDVITVANGKITVLAAPGIVPLSPSP